MGNSKKKKKKILGNGLRRKTLLAALATHTCSSFLLWFFTPVCLWKNEERRSWRYWHYLCRWIIKLRHPAWSSWNNAHLIVLICKFKFKKKNNTKPKREEPLKRVTKYEIKKILQFSAKVKTNWNRVENTIKGTGSEIWRNVCVCFIKSTCVCVCVRSIPIWNRHLNDLTGAP